MKRIIGTLAFAALTLLVACNDEKTVEKKEVIVVPAPEKKAETPPEKSTSVTVDKNGVKVESKKVDVNIQK